MNLNWNPYSCCIMLSLLHTKAFPLGWTIKINSIDFYCFYSHFQCPCSWVKMPQGNWVYYKKNPRILSFSWPCVLKTFLVIKFDWYLFKNEKAVAETVFKWQSLGLWNVNITIFEHLYWHFHAGWYWFPLLPEEKVSVHKSDAAICNALKWWSDVSFFGGVEKTITCCTRVLVSMHYN